MSKVTGIIVLLIYICIVTALLNDRFVDSGNLTNVVRRTALFGIIGVGVAFVIITGGIDLSIGSLIGLVGCVLAMCLSVRYEPIDQSAIVSLSAADKSLLLEQPIEDIKPGDRFAVFDGKASNQNVYEIQDRSGSTANDVAAAGSKLQLADSPPGDDSQGKAMRVYEIVDIDREAKSFSFTNDDASLKSGDQLEFFSPGFQRTQQLEVANASKNGGVWRVTVEALPDGFEEQSHVGIVRRHAWPIWIALTLIAALVLFLGLAHGLLITKLKLQPFIVTLCGLMIYRGVARTITDDQTLGFGTEYSNSLRLFAIGTPISAATLIAFVGVLISAILFWGWLKRRRKMIESGEETLAWQWLFASLFALATAVIGSSRFWFGWELDASLAEREPMQLLGLNVPYWPYTVTRQAALMPSTLMQWLGWMAIPSGLVFLVLAFLKNAKRMVLPAVMLTIAIALFVGGVAVGNMSEASFGSWANWSRAIQIAFVFVVTGVLIGSLAWLGQVGFRDGSKAVRVFGLLAAGLGVLGLVGRTELPETLVPAPFLIFLLVALASALFIKQTIFGRYLFALGRNEQAARFSGIRTDRMVILAYVLCAACAGLGGILFALDVNSVQPAQQGSFYELYAIAAAVIGGCSLRGGEGSILGVVIGAALMQFLSNSIYLVGIPDQLELTIIGVVILTGAVADEVVRRISIKRQATSS